MISITKIVIFALILINLCERVLNYINLINLTWKNNCKSGTADDTYLIGFTDLIKRLNLVYQINQICEISLISVICGSAVDGKKKHRTADDTDSIDL